jgi:hypothetical protein
MQQVISIPEVELCGVSPQQKAVAVRKSARHLQNLLAAKLTATLRITISIEQNSLRK